MLFKKQISITLIISLFFLNLQSSLLAMDQSLLDNDHMGSSLLDSSSSSSGDSPPQQSSPNGSPTRSAFLSDIPSPSKPHLMLSLGSTHESHAQSPKFNLDDLRNLISKNPKLHTSLGWMSNELHHHNSRGKNWAFLALGTGISALSLWGVDEVFSADGGVGFAFKYLLPTGVNNTVANIVGISAVMAAVVPELYEMTTVPRDIYNWIEEPKQDLKAQKKRGARRWFFVDMTGLAAITTMAALKTAVQYQILRDAFQADLTAPHSYFSATVGFFLFSQFTKLYRPPARWWGGVMEFLMQGRNSLVRDHRHDLKTRTAAAYRRIWDMNPKDTLTTLMILSAIDEAFPSLNHTLSSPSKDATSEEKRQYEEAKAKLELNKRTKEFLYLSFFLDPEFAKGYRYQDPKGLQKWVRWFYDTRHPWYHNVADASGKVVGAVGSGAAYYLYQYSGAQVFKDPVDYENGYHPSSKATAYGAALAILGTTIMMQNLSKQFQRLVDQIAGYNPNVNQEMLREHIRIHQGSLKERLTTNEFLSDVFSTAVSAYLTLPTMLQEVHAQRLIQFTQTRDYENLGFNEFLPLASFLEIGQQSILFDSLGQSMREALRKIHESKVFRKSKGLEQILNLSRHKVLEGLVSTSHCIGGLTDSAIETLYSNLKEIHTAVDGFRPPKTETHVEQPKFVDDTTPVVITQREVCTQNPEDVDILQGFTFWLGQQGIDVQQVGNADMDVLTKRYWDLRTRKTTRLFPEEPANIHPSAIVEELREPDMTLLTQTRSRPGVIGRIWNGTKKATFWSWNKIKCWGGRGKAPKHRDDLLVDPGAPQGDYELMERR